jgi:molybdenum cofactor guanylyltransferase
VSTALFGLVLAGGRSKRMGQDKAALVYDGRSQLDRAMNLLAPLVTRAFVSVRADQNTEPTRAKYAQIVDLGDIEGPAAGICAAQLTHPDVAWLIIACDLPHLNIATLQQLIAQRDPARLATAYDSSTGLPEPLCAIYEAQSAVALQAFIRSGRTCPRKFLLTSDTLRIPLGDSRALDNVNTPDELAATQAGAAIPATAGARQLRVQYFALLREQAGRRDESVTTTAATALDLYAELAARYRFTLRPEHLKVAINTQFSDWHRPLQDGDAVVFIPPVAGG